jgi:hypothetical protein
LGSVSLLEGKLPIKTLAPILDLIPKGKLLPSRTIGMDAGIVEVGGKWIVSSSGIAIGGKEALPEVMFRMSRALKKMRGAADNLSSSVASRGHNLLGRFVATS